MQRRLDWKDSHKELFISEIPQQLHIPEMKRRPRLLLEQVSSSMLVLPRQSGWNDPPSATSKVGSLRFA